MFCVPVKECDCRVGPKGQLPRCLASGEVVDDADGAAGPYGVHEGVAEAGDGGEVTTEEEESLEETRSSVKHDLEAVKRFQSKTKMSNRKLRQSDSISFRILHTV